MTQHRRALWTTHLSLSMLCASITVTSYAADLPPVSVQTCNQPGFQQVLHPSSSKHEARAFWLSREVFWWPGAPAAAKYKLYSSPKAGVQTRIGAQVSGAQAAYPLQLSTSTLPPEFANSHRYAGSGPSFNIVASNDLDPLTLLRSQLVIAAEDAQGKLIAATELQTADVLDALYATPAETQSLGATLGNTRTDFHLWAPSAQSVALCRYPDPSGPAKAVLPMKHDAASGVWGTHVSSNLKGSTYRYVVDVYVRGVGVVRNLVTDPYSQSLTADSARSAVIDLSNPATQPKDWQTDPAHAKAAARVKQQTDMSVYELHVRDFSISDTSVPAAHRGKYLAFTDAQSNGMRHLQALSEAGITDIHLLPVFDFGSVPEHGCVTPELHGKPDGMEQQAAVMAHASEDCYNWGYDPYHYSAPEGSYSSDANNPLRRVLELRSAVQALHRAGLRVGMDVVYNHTYASGQKAKSVLDRIVPGYYHRLNANGEVEQSTCCDNTATEHRMMAKLVLESLELWAREYKIDSFRFDLMAHMPRDLLEKAKARLATIQGHPANLIGEGWNFGEIANGARFVQASQLSLNGSGIATFSDRARDALRGGQGQGPNGIVADQGYLNGLIYDPNQDADQKRPRIDLLKAADMVRVGLAGSLRDYQLQTHDDKIRPLSDIAYGDQPAGYVSAPSEVVNYVENHDNQTLFDLNAYKLPLTTNHEDRVRSQMLGAAIVAFSQGVAYFHAGQDILRSKSMDGNSFDSGDWFNRLDWSYQSNGFASGMPPERDNHEHYPQIEPRLANSNIAPRPQDIAMARDMFRDILKIRASTSLFHLATAEDIRQRLHFYNTGSQQEPTVLIAKIDGEGYPGANFKSLVYVINVDKQGHSLTIPELRGHGYVLHPVLASSANASGSTYAAETGTFSVAARSSTVFVAK